MASFSQESKPPQNPGRFNEQTILQYIRDQEAEEKRLEQLRLKGL